MPHHVSKTSKRALIGIFAVFSLPVILAKVALDQHWFNPGVTNKGELLSPKLDLQQWVQDIDHKWQLIYVLPAQCSQRCENALRSIHQVWLALGRETDRAQPLVLVSAQSDVVKLAELRQDNVYQVRTFSTAATASLTPSEEQNIFIADTQGQVILRYPTQSDVEKAVLASRDILADMRKLLKLSRIG